MPRNNNKKIFIFILVVLLAIVTAFLIYYFFYSQNTGVTDNPPGNPPTGTPGGTTFPPPKPPLPPSGGGTGTGGRTTAGAFKPILRQITNVPTASGIVFDKGGKPTIRYIERAKGNVYETDAVSIKALRLSNTTIPQISEAVWKKTGDNVIARFLKDDGSIQSFDATVVPKTGGEGELRGEFLSANIKNLVVSPSGTQIFYLLDSPSGLIGIASSFDGKKKVQVFDSPLHEWLPEWPKEDTVAVTSKAGAGDEGLLTLINTGTGKSEVVLSGVKGLTTLVNSDASRILYSESSQSNLQNRLFKVADKSSSFFPLVTLPEKCVWSKIKKNIIFCAVPNTLPSGNYPDSWYQGTISFHDELWEIDTDTSNTDFIMNLSDQSRQDFDAMNLSLNDKENFLLLTNKNDLTLWEVQLAQ